MRNAGLFLLALPATLALAQQKITTVTLDQAIATALERNIGIVQAENTLELQESGRLAAYGELLPSVNASGSWTRSQVDRAATQSQVFGGATFTIPTSFSVTNNFSSRVDLSYTVFNGFANTASLNSSQSRVSSAEHSLRRTRQQTSYETTQLYLNVLRMKELVKVQEENLKRSQRQLERIEEANRVGSLSLADVYRQQVQVGSDELALIQSQNDYDKAKADLAFYLSLNILEEYEFADPAISLRIDTSEIRLMNERYGNFYALVEEAMKIRPDYQSTLEAYNSAGSDVTVARAGHFPAISAFASYGYSSDALSRLGNNKNATWGLQVSLPLFSGFRIDNQVQQARINERNAYEQLKQAERKVQVDIKKALLDFEAARKQIDVTEKSVRSAEQDRRIAEEKYNLGAGTLLDLLVANANFVSAASNRVNAVYNYNLVKKQLEFAAGTLTY